MLDRQQSLAAMTIVFTSGLSSVSEPLTLLTVSRRQKPIKRITEVHPGDSDYLENADISLFDTQ